jgi:hypothetical protein
VSSGVHTAEEAVGVGDKGSGDTARVDVQTLKRGLSGHVPEMSVSITKISSGTIQNFQYYDYSPKELVYEDF